jgi:hypothetical protein
MLRHMLLRVLSNPGLRLLRKKYLIIIIILIILIDLEVTI